MKNQQIKGTTRITGLLGNPVKHSISPLIHNHAFAELGLDYTYLPLGCEEERLEGLVESLKALNFAGANVTIPYKSAVIPFCDEISKISELTGTVNTLTYKDGRLHGTTTDAIGFLRALESEGFDIDQKRVVILGNGGTARTLAMVLAHESRPASLTIVGRNQEKVQILTNEIAEKTGYPISYDLFLNESFQTLAKEADLVVNCTPIGMSPNTDSSPLPKELYSSECYYFDAIYNPGETLFLQQAKECGSKYQNGLKMLLFQGLASFSKWTDTPTEKTEPLFSIDELQAIVSK